MAELLTITESTFKRRVLAAPTPVVVRFGTAVCAACRALTPLLKRLASTYAEQLLVGTINADTAPFLVEQYTVEATPTILIFQHGEPMTRVVGFVEEGLLRIVCDQAVQGNLSPELVWRPTEVAFEDAVIVPLLHAWGFTYARQVPCSLRTNGAKQYGRIDFLVYDHPAAQPLTLFENKRLIMSERDLQGAAIQARTYAQALRLSSFVVAAPSGMWIYRLDSGQAVCIRTLTSLEIHQHPSAIQRLLIQLSR